MRIPAVAGSVGTPVPYVATWPSTVVYVLLDTDSRASADGVMTMNPMLGASRPKAETITSSSIAVCATASGRFRDTGSPP
ncbi:MAG: hypothetical protein ACYC9N_18795 [Thermoanaerobaculia bacterium]